MNSSLHSHLQSSLLSLLPSLLTLPIIYPISHPGCIPCITWWVWFCSSCRTPFDPPRATRRNTGNTCTSSPKHTWSTPRGWRIACVYGSTRTDSSCNSVCGLRCTNRWECATCQISLYTPPGCNCTRTQTLNFNKHFRTTRHPKPPKKTTAYVKNLTYSHTKQQLVYQTSQIRLPFPDHDHTLQSKPLYNKLMSSVGHLLHFPNLLPLPSN